jgi:peroxiredoxin
MHRFFTSNTTQVSTTTHGNLNSNSMKKTSSVFTILLALLAMSFTKGTGPGGYTIGDTAIDFNLKNVNGKMVSLSKIKNAKGYIVVFTCNHCPYAKAYEDRIISLHKKYAEMGYPVVAINSNDPVVAPNDSYAKMKVRAKAKKFPFVYLYDATQEIAKTYGATRTPHVYLLDDKRVVRYLENAIEALKAGKDIAVKETKAIGCGIKWKKS